MRTVVKAAFRSFGSSTATNVVSLESQLRPDKTNQLKRKDIGLTDNFSFLVSMSSRDMNRHFGIKTESLSTNYKLTSNEETCFEDLNDKECDYYPNNSVRGDIKVLNMDIKTNISEQNVNSTNIIFALKNIRFVNSIVFKQDFDVFLTTANYVQRLLHIRAVKKNLMQFIAAALYDLALEHNIGKKLTKDEVVLLLSLTDIPINHIEDFSRMKALLLLQLDNDLESISIVNYLQILMRLDLNYDVNSLPEWHGQLIDIVSVLATSCELTHFTMACQAITLVNVAARHVSFDSSFNNRFSDIIDKFPLIFVSPVRLQQFAKLDSVADDNIKHCAECIIRFFSKYYDDCSAKKRQLAMRKDSVDEDGSRLWTLVEEIEERVEVGKVKEEMGEIGSEKEERENDKEMAFRGQQKLDIGELMAKLSRVSLALNSHINGKQKQRQKRIKKTICRQLKKYDGSRMVKGGGYKPLIIDDEDSAISSSSNMTSPANSPLSF